MIDVVPRAPEPADASRRSDATSNDDAIIAAAQRLMDAGAATSVRDVAREAGLGVTTVYRRFASSDALLSRAVAARLCDELADVVASALDDEPMAGLRTLTDRLIDETARVRGTTTLDDLAGTFLSRYDTQLSTLLARALAAGTIRPDITRDDIRGVTTVIFAGVALSTENVHTAHRYVALLFDGLTRPDATRLPEFPR